MSENNIFTELYNKLLGFFRQAEEQDNSKDVARNRLRVVLMQDRTNLTPQLLDRMRGELVELLSKYLEMDKDALELNLEQEGEQMALALSIPVIRAKDEEEIEQAIKESEKEKEEAAAAEVEEEENDIDADEELESDTDEEVTQESDKNSEDDKETEVQVKKFPDKAICGECRECEYSADIECEKKQPKPKKSKKK